MQLCGLRLVSQKSLLKGNFGNNEDTISWSGGGNRAHGTALSPQSHEETFSENHRACWGLVKRTNVSMPSACLVSQALWDFSAKSHVVEGKQNLSYA